MKFVTEDGSVLYLAADPETRRVSLVVLPSELSHDAGELGESSAQKEVVLDIFQCALSEETVKRLHKCLQQKKPFRCVATDFRVISSGKKLELLFKRDFAPGHYRVTLPANDSQTFRDAVVDSISLIQGIEFVPAPYHGIKVSCPEDFQPHTLETIEQAMAHLNVTPMTEAEFWFESGIYLFEAPKELFEGNSLSVAAKCFRFALESWSPEAVCKLDDIRINLSSTLSATGQSQVALDLLEAVGERKNRFWVVRANCLQSLERHEEAVFSYERAIEEEPSFWLPHVRILQSLREIGSERYEFYLELAFGRFRENPWIACYWAEHLFKQNRLHELEEADWIDQLTNEQASRVTYSPMEDQERIVRARQFRAVGQAQAALLRFLDEGGQEEKNIADTSFSAAVASLRPRDLRRVSCDPAKALLAIAASLGKVGDFTEITGSICGECLAAGTGLLGPLEAYEARGWLVSGNESRAVDCAEAALIKEDGNIFALESLMMARDHLGQFEGACLAARKIEAAEPTYPTIKRHIGRLFLQTGELAKARLYIENWLSDCSEDLVMMDQLVCLELLDHSFEKAESAFGIANGLISDNVLTFKDIGGHENAVVPFSQRRQSAFEELMEFARGHDNHPEYGRLVLSRMEQSSAFGQLFAQLRPSVLDVAGLFEQILNAPSHLEMLEVKRGLALHQKGDHSGLAVQLGQRVHGWDSLPDAARLSLLEAARSINRGESIDYAPSVVAAAKSLEVALKQLVFDGFRAWFLPNPRCELALAQAREPKYEKVLRLRELIVKNAFLELGSMLLILRLGTGKTVRECLLLQSLVEFVSAKGMETVLEAEFVDGVDAIAKLRNEAAHSGNIARDQASELLDRVVSSLGVFGSNAEETRP